MASAKDIAEGLNNVASSFKDLANAAQGFTVGNAIGLAIGNGPWHNVLSGISSTVNVLTTVTAVMQNIPQNLDADGDLLLAALKNYSEQSGKLLNAIIDKAGISKTATFVRAPYASVLRQLERADDGVLYLLIDNVPKKADEIKSLAIKVDNLQAKAVEAYTDGL